MKPKLPKIGLEHFLLAAWVFFLILTVIVWTAAIFIDSIPAEGNLTGFGFITLVVGLVLLATWGIKCRDWEV